VTGGDGVGGVGVGLVLLVPMSVGLVMMVVGLVLNGRPRACQHTKPRRPREWLRKGQTKSAPSGLYQTHTHELFLLRPGDFQLWTLTRGSAK
jgi:hypothetical protein